MAGISAGMDLQQHLALDVQALNKLRQDGGANEAERLREACRQFEALFLHTMLKSMRQAVPDSGLLQSSQLDFYQSLQDQQWSEHLAGRGLGLADQLARQLDVELSRNAGSSR